MKSHFEAASLELHEATSFPGFAAGLSQPLRVVVCSPHQLFVSALRSLFNQKPQYVVTGEALAFDASLEKAVRQGTDVILVDFDLADRNAAAMSSLEAFLQKTVDIPTVILSSVLDPDMCQRALRAGVTGIVSKNTSGEALMDVVDQVSKGRMWLERSLVTSMFADSSHNVRAKCADSRKIAELTPRELEIVATASTGATNRHIGERLFISSSTVRHHLSSIFAKLGVASRGELMVYAYRHNLAGPSARSSES